MERPFRPLSFRGVALSVWAAALPIHRFFDVGPGRVGAGDWLFPLAIAAVVPALIRRSCRPLGWFGFVPALVIALGFAPSVLFNGGAGTSLLQWGILVYVASIFAVARAAAILGHEGDVLRGYVVGSAVSALWGFASTRTDAWLVQGWPRPVGPTESPNMLAIEMVAALAALSILSSHARAKIAFAVLAMLFVATIVATLGHVTIAAFAALAFFAWRTSKTRFVRVAGLGGVVVGVAALVGSIVVRGMPLSSSWPFFDFRPTPYAVCHRVALEMFGDHPLVGVGLARFRATWPAYDDGVRFASAYQGGQDWAIGVPLDPHSTYLGALAEGGIGGGLVVVALGIVAWRTRRSARCELDCLFVFLVLVGFVASVLTNRELALVVGVLSFSHEIRRSKDVADSLRG